MAEQRVQRRLAAILAADVVGYSALMQRAEEATYAEFERLKRELIEPSLSRHEGRLIVMARSPSSQTATLAFNVAMISSSEEAPDSDLMVGTGLLSVLDLGESVTVTDSAVRTASSSRQDRTP